MAMAELATPADVLDQVRNRTSPSGRWGLGLASTYLRQIEATCDPTKEMGISAEIWAASMKRAEQTLTWCQDDMAPESVAIPAEPAGDGTDENHGSRVRRLSEEDWFYKAADLAPGAILEFDAVLTSKKRDRDGDILLPKGAELDPDMPLLWQHEPHKPIGKFLTERRRNATRIVGRLAIADTLLGRDAATLVEFGALRISHGFIPDMDGCEPIKEGEEGWLIKLWKMIEVSLVSVPSNTDAVIVAFNNGKLFHPAIKAWAKREHDERPVQTPGITLEEAASAMHTLSTPSGFKQQLADAGKAIRLHALASVPKVLGQTEGLVRKTSKEARQDFADTPKVIELEVPDELDLGQDADWIYGRRQADGKYVLHSMSVPKPDTETVEAAKADHADGKREPIDDVIDELIEEAPPPKDIGEYVITESLGDLTMTYRAPTARETVKLMAMHNDAVDADGDEPLGELPNIANVAATVKFDGSGSVIAYLAQATPDDRKQVRSALDALDQQDKRAGLLRFMKS